MGRPSMAFRALCRSPTVETRRANSAGVERVPRVAALARPQRIGRRRPSAQWAADARPLGSGGLLVPDFGNDVWFIHATPALPLSRTPRQSPAERQSSVLIWQIEPKLPQHGPALLAGQESHEAPR